MIGWGDGPMGRIGLIRLMGLIWPIRLIRPNKPDKPNKPNGADKPGEPPGVVLFTFSLFHLFIFLRHFHLDFVKSFAVDADYGALADEGVWVD